MFNREQPHVNNTDNIDTTVPVFLNKPIHDKSKDAIGFQSSTELLSQAIDSGAELIAVSGPFGSGKSSVIELLKTYRKNREDQEEKTTKVNRKNECFVSIQMWPHLISSDCPDPSELHKHLTYQLAAKIDPRIGTYINRRNSPDYRLITAHVNKRNFIWLAAVLILFILLGNMGWDIVKTLVSASKFSSLRQLADIGITNWLFLGVTSLLKYTVFAFALFCLPKLEIALSTHKSVNNRKVEEDEIIDVFQNNILKKKSKRTLAKTYIVVIEDLDRCQDSALILTFLRELRKYYLSGSDIDGQYYNRICFIVNISPEALLQENSRKSGNKTVLENESTYNGKPVLYEKLFDYILDLQPIHSDSYETVLNDILKPYVTVLIKEGIIRSDCSENPTKSPGMNRIVLGKGLGIREIKHRLNLAIQIFESLHDRFPDRESDISFEKCAVVAYLTTEFESDFWATDDHVFGSLVSMNMETGLTFDKCQETIQKSSKHLFSESYINEVWELIRSRKIDDSYRRYLYNYPKGSEMFTYAESSVQDAILYGDSIPELSHYVNLVIQTRPMLIKDTMQRRVELGKPLPAIIFDNEILYCQSLHTQKKSTTEAMELLLENAKDKTRIIDKIIDVLHFDSNRNKYKEEIAQTYCDIWEKQLSEGEILSLREKLCQEFSREILWYKSLFFGSHWLIRPIESNFLPFIDTLRLFNYNNPQCGIKDIRDIVNQYQPDLGNDTDEEMKRLLEAILSEYDPVDTFDIYIQYMSKRKFMVPSLEQSVYTSLGTDPGNAAGFDAYRNLINDIAVHQKLSTSTLDNIVNSQNFKGFSSAVSRQMYEQGYYFEYVLMRLHSHDPIDFDTEEIRKSVEEGIKTTSGQETFQALRLRITKNAEDLMLYRFMFDKEHPFMTKDELNAIGKKLTASELLHFWPGTMITNHSADMLLEYWNAKHRHNTVAVEILDYISKLVPNFSQYCFNKVDFWKKIKYFEFSPEKRMHVKKQFHSILTLGELTKMLDFIHTTHYMDEDWLHDHQSEIIGNTDIEEAFADAINNCSDSSIQDVSIDTIKQMTGFYAFTTFIESRLLESGIYLKYIASTTLRQKKFDMETTSHEDDLWNAYINLYQSSTNDSIFDYMRENRGFIREMMELELYKGLDQTHRLPFARVSQTLECLKDLDRSGFSTDDKTAYLKCIAGFDSVATEKYFIDMVKASPELLQNNDIYKHVYPLLSSPRKALYTKLRTQKTGNQSSRVVVIS